MPQDNAKIKGNLEIFSNFENLSTLKSGFTKEFWFYTMIVIEGGLRKFRDLYLASTEVSCIYLIEKTMN